jgi:hypothetical protein
MSEPPKEKKRGPVLASPRRSNVLLAVGSNLKCIPSPWQVVTTIKKDALLEMFLKAKAPNDESFFVFSVVSDDPDTPTWDFRQSFAGTYEEAAARCIRYLGLMAQLGRLASDVRVEVYSGAGARAYLEEAARQEIRYQRERCGQANN